MFTFGDLDIGARVMVWPGARWVTTLDLTPIIFSRVTSHGETRVGGTPYCFESCLGEVQSSISYPFPAR